MWKIKYNFILKQYVIRNPEHTFLNKLNKAAQVIFSVANKITVQN